MNVSRENIINALADKLRDDPLVHAMWLEGSDAHGLQDEYSDIDIWLDVEDGQADAVLGSVREILSLIGPLDYDVEGSNPHPRIRQAFLHIQGTPEFMVLDVCIQDHSREIAFLKGYADQKVEIIFDKCGVIRYQDADWEAFRRELCARADELSRVFALGGVGVRRGLGRGDYLEALSYYHDGMLKPLVEILRIRHQPTKHDFGLKHIRRDLPAEAVARLEYLFAVSSLADIEAKCMAADVLFRETSGGLDG